MKKLHYVISSLAMVIAFTAVVPLASAQTAANDCSTTNIENSGPGSVNLITCENTSTVKIDCNNNTTVTLNSDQVAQSGDVTIKGNTIAGNAKSGDSENIAYENINLTAVCAALTTKVTPTPTPAPVTPAPAPTPAPVVAALPYTSDAPTTVEKASVAAGIAVIVALFALAGTKLYAKFNS